MILVDSAGRPTGVVSEAALAALPEERRPWVPVASTAKSLQDGMVLGLGVSGEDLLRAMRRQPTSEYLVVDEGGRAYGVLVASDVDSTLSRS